MANSAFQKSNVPTPVSIANGGTGATTAPAAMTALGVIKAVGSEITTGTDDAKFLTAKALADATIGKLGGTWQAWTPTWTNVTLGNATVTARYTQIGKTVHFRISFVFGSSTSFTSTVIFSLPVTSIAYAGTATTQTFGLVTTYDNGTAITSHVLLYNNTTTAQPRIGGINATTPFTWVAGDELHIEGTYEAA